MSYNVNGYDFTIMPLDERYVEEICNDIKEQYEKGIAKLALFMFHQRIRLTVFAGHTISFVTDLQKWVLNVGSLFRHLSVTDIP